MMSNPKMKQYAEWAARVIIAVVILLITIGFNRLEDSRHRIDRKVDKTVFEKHCDDNREEFRRQALRNDEVIRLLIEMQTDIKWIKNEQQKGNGKN